MHVNRRTILYLSFSFVFAILMSVGLLQLSQSPVQSAPAEAPSAQNGSVYYTLTITKSLEGAVPATDWEFTVENSEFVTTASIPAVGGSTAISVPVGYYTVTETSKDGYLPFNSYCSTSIQIEAALLEINPYASNVEIIAGDEYCEFYNSQAATVTIVKDAVPDSSQPFTITVYPDKSNTQRYVLVDDGTGVSNTVSFDVLYAASIYEDVESAADHGWVPADAQCVDASGSPTGTVGSEFDYVGLEGVIAGEHYTCTFTNAMPMIELTKTVGTDAGVCAAANELDVFTGTEVHYCYTVENTGLLTLTQNALIDNVFGPIGPLPDELAPGEIFESVADGIVVTDVADIDITNVATWTAIYTDLLYNELPITLPVTSTARAQVNAYDPSQIIINKSTMPADSEQEFGLELVEEGGTSIPFTVSSASSYTSPLLLPGVYSVTEQLIEEGWVQIGDPTCVDDTGKSYDASNIQLPPGVTVTCAFTNAKQARIFVDKTTTPATTDVFFDFTLSGDGYLDTFSLAHNTPVYESEWLMPGAYSLSEADKTDWTLESAVCTGEQTPDNIVLDYGEETLCEFVNKSTPTALDDVDFPNMDKQQFLPWMAANE